MKNSRLFTYARLVKFEHTLFAMPFALMGFFLGLYQENGSFTLKLLILVVLCMVFARNAAMGFNRYLDRKFDILNPRTAAREIPAGVIRPQSALIFVIANVILFMATTWFINRLCFYLSPVALFVILFYSFTKRITPLCHFVLSLGLAIAPIGAYLAVAGKFGTLPLLIGGIVFFWVSGFDIIYALQDEEFDKKWKLKSIPALMGKKNALRLSLLVHLISAILVAAVAGLLKGNWLVWTGSAIFVFLLFYQHLLVKSDDLSRVNLAFFTTNGIASLIYGTLFIAGLLVVRNFTEKNNTRMEMPGPLNENKADEAAYEIVNLKSITSDGSFASPVWSPDGIKTAFTSVNFRGIYVKNHKNGTLKQITADDGAGFRFSWSPDSKLIVYLSRRIKDGEPANTIKVVHAETGEMTDLTKGLKGVSMPGFTGSGGIIYSLNTTLILQKPTGHESGFSQGEVIAENVPANIVQVAPVTQKIIVEDNEGIKIMDADGKNRKTIIKNGENDFACNTRVSPDGSKVLFYNNTRKTGHLFVYDTDSGRLTDIGPGNSGDWLPDGKIIFCIPESGHYLISNSDIYVTNSDGSGKTRINRTEEQIELQPSVAPDGKMIAYRDDKSGQIFTGGLKIKN